VKNFGDAEVNLFYDPEPVQNALHVLEKSVTSLETQLKVHCGSIGDIWMYTSHKGSFRERDVLTTYKANRAGMRKPHHLMACKEWLLDNFHSECRVGELEADDLMAMWSTYYQRQGKPVIIASIDKDLKQIPGWHFDFVKNKLVEVSEIEGMQSLYRQMLTGDATDGIPGLYGVGPKTAEKLINNVQSEYMMYCVVLKEYLARTKQEDGESFEEFTERVVATIRIHAQLLYLLRNEEEYWDAPLAGPGIM